MLLLACAPTLRIRRIVWTEHSPSSGGQFRSDPPQCWYGSRSGRRARATNLLPWTGPRLEDRRGCMQAPPRRGPRGQGQSISNALVVDLSSGISTSVLRISSSRIFDALPVDLCRPFPTLKVALVWDKLSLPLPLSPPKLSPSRTRPEPVRDIATSQGSDHVHLAQTRSGCSSAQPKKGGTKCVQALQLRKGFWGTTLRAGDEMSLQDLGPVLEAACRQRAHGSGTSAKP